MRLELTRPQAAVLAVLAWLAGWALLTAALTALVRGQWEVAVWQCSAGLIALGLGGPRLLWTVLTNGIYALTAPPTAAKETER